MTRDFTLSFPWHWWKSYDVHLGPSELNDEIIGIVLNVQLKKTHSKRLENITSVLPIYPINREEKWKKKEGSKSTIKRWASKVWYKVPDQL